MAWRYLASRLNGDGTETFLDYNLPLSGAEIFTELSGPGSISGSISPAVAALRGADGEPILKPWSTAIYAEEDGRIRAGAILENLTETGPALELDAVGFTGYLKDEPYTGVYSVTRKDAFEVVRHIWAHAQAKRAGDLGVDVSANGSGILLGEPEAERLTEAKDREAQAQDVYDVREAQYQAAQDDYEAAVKAYETARDAYNADKTEAKKTAMDNADAVRDDKMAVRDAARDVRSTAREALNRAKDAVRELKDGEAKPYELLWWDSFDLGGEIDDLAADHGFDYRMEHAWREDGGVRHHLRLDRPIGRRRDDLRFMVGENVYTLPQVGRDGEDYADTVVVLGAGEGRKMIRATASKVGGRLHRTKIVEDKSIRLQARAERLAEALLRQYSGEEEIDEIGVLDHLHAPVGSYDVGDEILVQYPSTWSGALAVWSRVLSITFSPETGSSRLELVRV